MSNKKFSSIELFAKIVGKTILVLLLPPVVIFGLFFAGCSLLIDAISSISDRKIMSETEAKKRDIERTNQRRHGYLNFLIEYFKLLIS